MSLGLMVPVKRRDWKYFDRQKVVYEDHLSKTRSVLGKNKIEDLLKSFDDELERARRDLFHLKAIDFDNFDDDFSKDFGLSQKSGLNLERNKRKTDFDDFDIQFEKSLADAGFKSNLSGKEVTSFNETKSRIDRVDECFSSPNRHGKFRLNDDSKALSSLNAQLDKSLSNMLSVENPIVQSSDGKNRLALRFDVSRFQPHEVKVNCRDNVLSVEAEHKEESATKKVYQKFSRQYILPNKIEGDKLTSLLSADGVLEITGPAPLAESSHRINLLPIDWL